MSAKDQNKEQDDKEPKKTIRINGSSNVTLQINIESMNGEAALIEESFSDETTGNTNCVRENTEKVFTVDALMHAYFNFDKWKSKDILDSNKNGKASKSYGWIILGIVLIALIGFYNYLFQMKCFDLSNLVVLIISAIFCLILVFKMLGRGFSPFQEERIQALNKYLNDAGVVISCESIDILIEAVKERKDKYSYFYPFSETLHTYWSKFLRPILGCTLLTGVLKTLFEDYKQILEANLSSILYTIFYVCMIILLILFMFIYAKDFYASIGNPYLDLLSDLEQMKMNLILKGEDTENKEDKDKKNSD